MKTLGLIGGLSWYSTVVYYRTINRLINEQLGNSHSAKILLYSVDFEEFRLLQEDDDWAEVERMLLEIALMLERNGADCIVMCTNTPHLVADAIREKLGVPLLHIAEETAKAIVAIGLHEVGLIGTRFTMENAFFTERLSTFGIRALVPESADRDYIHNSIFSELTCGRFEEETRNEYFSIIRRLAERGAEGVIFGCTEISLLVDPKTAGIPVFDTATIHATSAVEFALR